MKLIDILTLCAFSAELLVTLLFCYIVNFCYTLLFC